MSRRQKRALSRAARAGLAALVAVGFALLPLLASPVLAEISGHCEATINGVDVRTVSSGDAGSAIEVKEHTEVPVTVSSAAPVTGHKIQLEFAGIRWTVSEDDDTEPAWSGSVDVDKYARYGVGLYKVIGKSEGPGACEGAALVKVSGNPLTTVAGAAAAGAVAVGAVAMAGSAVASAVQPPAPHGYFERLTTDLVEDAALAEMTDDERRRYFNRKYPPPPPPQGLGLVFTLCSILALPGLLLTVGAMLTGAGGEESRPEGDGNPSGGGASGVLPDVADAGAASARRERPLPHVRWRPRISLASVLGGILAGAGTAVLLQQYAVTPLTRAVAIEFLAGGFVVGLLLPSLLRVVAVWRANRKLARLLAKR